MSKKIYEMVTKAVIKQLEAVDPKDFEKPWFNLGSPPVNAISKKPYRGINHIMLKYDDYTSGHYASFKQWSGKDCKIKKGEKATPVIFWKILENKDTLDTFPLIRYYNVFNSEQVEGDFAREIEKPSAELKKHETISEAEKLIHGYMKHEFLKSEKSDRAYYSSSKDLVGMPDIGQFKDPESYYAVYLHELTHSTGHEKRLKRDLANNFGSVDYAKEELVAELGSAFLCGCIGLTNKPREDHAQYLASWLKALQNDHKFIISAASKAQKAADMIQEKALAWEDYEDRAQLMAAE